MLGISISHVSEIPVEENLCLLHAKYFIYGCKYREQKLSFSNFIKYLESKHNVEMYIAKKNNQIEEHRKRWGCVYKYFHWIKIPTISSLISTKCAVVFLYFFFPCNALYSVIYFENKCCNILLLWTDSATSMLEGLNWDTRENRTKSKEKIMVDNVVKVKIHKWLINRHWQPKVSWDSASSKQGTGTSTVLGYQHLEPSTVKYRSFQN